MFYRLRKRLAKEIDKTFFRISRAQIDEALRKVGLRKGDVVCVHSMLSRTGFFVDGPEAIIDSLVNIVGQAGSIMMPTFPTRGSMLAYLDEGNVFDVRNSPSRVGFLTETFRRRPGVRRSLHPTSPVAAWGDKAEFFIEGHENSLTPYGNDTPYGRMITLDRCFILMIGVPILTLAHHLQEKVEFPNLFLPGIREVEVIDRKGRRQHMRTRIIRPRIPYYVAIPSARTGGPDWAILHDYLLMFPRERDRKVQHRGFSFAGYPRLYDRRKNLEAAGILRTAKLGKTEFGLLECKAFADWILPEFSDLIDQFRTAYDPDRIAALNLPYL